MMRRLAIVCAILAVGGCRQLRTWGDLNAPQDWRALSGDVVRVAGTGVLLPIVTDDTPEDRWAATLLAQTIESVWGGRPQVFVETHGRELTFDRGIFIGRVAANGGWSGPPSERGPDAFRVVAADGAVRFLGRADFGVFDWCERELGLRAYPYVGQTVSRRGEVVVEPADYSDWPVYDHRELSGRVWPLWTKVAKTGSSHRASVNVHQPAGWVTNAAIRAAHPEIFENGETPMLCYGKRETLDYYRRRIARHVAGVEDSGGIVDGRRKVVTVCQWDAPIRCTCGDCRIRYDARLGPAGSASPIIWGRFLPALAAWLKAEHPDYVISFLPYWNTCAVPDELKDRFRLVPGGRDRGQCGRRAERRSAWAPLGNAEAEVCTMPGLAMLKNRSCREREESLLRAWRRATGRKVLNWNYGCWPLSSTAAPYVFGRTVRDHCRDMRDVVSGVFVCGDDGNARNALSIYVWMRCLWNPEIDVESLYDEFAVRAFGPAADPMRRLIALQEACWSRQWPDDACSHANVFGISYPPEDVVRMKALAAEACARVEAAGDETSAARLNWYLSGFDEFFAEADALQAREPRRTILPGRRYEMANGRSARHPTPWAKTTVETRQEGTSLRLEVRCEEPAAERMDFSRTVRDAVAGNDSVIFVFELGGRVRQAKVDLAGGVEGGWRGFAATTTHDRLGWTVRASVELEREALERGTVRGNVARWRVGDRRLPAASRVKGSRYELSRLNTCYTNVHADPAGFVDFVLERPLPRGGRRPGS